MKEVKTTEKQNMMQNILHRPDKKYTTSVLNKRDKSVTIDSIVGQGHTLSFLQTKIQKNECQPLSGTLKSAMKARKMNRTKSAQAENFKTMTSESHLETHECTKHTIEAKND